MTSVEVFGILDIYLVNKTILMDVLSTVSFNKFNEW
jgi:hypothetical protein